jgi:hypothetical protein
MHLVFEVARFIRTTYHSLSFAITCIALIFRVTTSTAMYCPTYASIVHNIRVSPIFTDALQVTQNSALCILFHETQNNIVEMAEKFALRTETQTKSKLNFVVVNVSFLCL